MTDSKRSKLAKIVLVTGTFLLPGLFVIACTDTRRGLGEQCLKGEDCQSNLCVSQQCASEPPFINGTGTPVNDASPDVIVVIDASDAGPITDSGSDSPTTTDASDAANGDD
ncbi:MAG TPA: hypothetical protein VF407_01140 [Polyangiaceae bacterium]